MMRPFRTHARPRLLAALAVAAALLLTSCGSGSGKTEGAADNVVVAVQSFAAENPLPWFQSAADKPLWSSMFDPLIRTNPQTGAFEPGLALSWTPSPDYTKWTFEIRKGVRFHDGTEMTAADVAFSLQQVLRPDATANISPYFKQTLASITTPSDSTVVLTFKRPTWEVLDYLQETQPFSVVPKAYVEAVGEDGFRQRPIGTGRYRFEEARRGDSYTFTRFDQYWDTEHPAGFARMQIKLVTDPAARMAGLRSGSLDAGLVFGDGLRQANAAGLHVVRRDGFAPYWIVLPGQVGAKWPDHCPDCPWVGDTDRALKVREAMNLAVNKQAIVDGIWAGAGTLDPYGFWVFESQKAWSPTLTVPPYDPERARKLLTEAGYPNGFDINVLSFRQVVAQDAPEVIQAVANDWARVGIRARITEGDSTAFIGKLRARDTGKNASVYGASYWASEPAAQWGASILSTGLVNLLVESPELDADLTAILGQTDAQARLAATKALGEKLWERHYGVMLGTRAITWVISDRIDAAWDPGPDALQSRVYDLRPAA
jgi:peptide/nickel transport system substrate-binding protein